ncbi:MAG: amino acid adenylation domain-containing protein [Pyrinomonadaceae bacterium]|nr:amino acid adenylation domain-containing protein [Pyrinomonadaceae bacterium]
MVKEVFVFPASFAQQRVWFLDQLAPDISLFNLSLAVRINGALNMEALRQAIDTIVARHESLRTTFANTDGSPIQVITPTLRVSLPVIEICQLPEAEREAEAHRLAIDEAQRPFDLTQGPLVRANLLRLDEREHVLLLTMHHIVSDDWSMGVFFRELATLYDAFSAGRPSPLEELPIQYADYAVWQQEWLRGEVLEQQLSYWKQHLAGAPAVLELPTDHPRPPVQTFRGTWQSAMLSGNLSEAVKRLSQHEGVTLFMTLLAAFQTLLLRYTNQEDIVVGSPIAGRTRAETEELIGFFINTLVLRTDLSGNPTFRELLRRVREVALGSYAHQDVPFDKLVEELQPERSLSHTPLSQVSFALQNAPRQALELAGLTLSRMDIDIGTAKFDLFLSVVEEAEGLRAIVEYNTDLFDASTITRMLEHFGVLLEGIIADPDQRLSELPLLTAAERHQLLFEWNDTAAEYPREKTLHELFEAQVERIPDAVALVYEDEQLTYRELNRRANQLAHYLQARGVGPEVLVGIMLERSVEMVVGVLGILKAGGAYVPLDAAYPPERLSFMLEDAAVTVLLTEQRMAESLSTSKTQRVCLDTERQQVAEQSAENLASGARAENLAYVIYTSGSTGKPKGVMITHRGLVNYLCWCTKEYRVAEGSGTLVHSPLGFDLTVTSLFAPLLVGQRLVLVREDQGIDALGAALRRAGDFSLIKLTPSHLEVLAEQLSATEVSGRARALIIGGEALVGESISFWQKHAPQTRIINEYGPTETVVGCCVYEAASETNITGAVPIGRPIANTQLYVLDSHLNPLPVGVSGELYIGGEGVARGYLNRPELTAEHFVKHPFSTEAGARLYKTGDLARYLPDGNLEFLGRIDDQVKMRGFRIELGEIEATLNQSAAVRDAVVIVRGDVPGDKRLVAYVVAAQNEAELTDSELRSFLKEKLPEYMVPSAYVVLDEIPLTPNGKVDRRGLPAPDEARPALEGMYVAPRTAVEAAVTEIWAEVLKVEQVGIHDNFFELGGHSLLATLVISRVRKSLQVELPLRSLFESPTAAALSERIEAARHSNEMLLDTPIPPASRDKELPLSFAQERLWFIDQLEPGGSAYNVPDTMRLTGHLNVEALRQALDGIVARHESLRTTFPVVQGRPAQVFAPSLNVALPIIDLGRLAESQREVEALRLVAEDVQRPFDLSRGPLVRARLFRLDEEEHILLLTLHHIISDGWSMGVLFRELGTLYEAFSAGRPSPLEELPIQYADYAVWQREGPQSESLSKQLSYWKEQLAGAPAVLELPTDKPRPAVQNFRGARQFAVLPKHLSQALNDLSRHENATIFMTLVAAFQTLLARYSGQEDISVGTDVSNRNRAETEGLIGFFLNHVVLRTDLSGNPTFRELLGRVREMALEAYAHQDVSFHKLVEVLKPERSLSHTSLFQVLFVLQNAPTEPLKLTGLTLRQLDFDREMSKFDLALFIEETEAGLIGNWVYKTDLFDATTVTRMAGHFETLLESIVAEPDAQLSDLEMLTESEKREQAMEVKEREESQIKKLKSARRKTVNLSQVNPVKSGYLQPGETLPLVFQPSVSDIDLADWAKNNREFIETELQKHGAILFRGFDIKAVSEFERMASAICPELFGEYGDLPREDVGGKVYASTPYPANQPILFHNESSHMHRWPMKIWFHCVMAAQHGGETPIVDCRKVYRSLSPQVRERFAQHGVMYVRNYTNGLDVDWQEFFQTTDKSPVEDYCQKASIDFEWKDGDGLRTRQVCRAVAQHPKTGETVFFNQVQLHHISCLEPSVRESLLAMFREEDLPRNCFYGDGSPIEDSVMQEIMKVYLDSAVNFPWQQGDILMLDNMLIAHGRNPFEGPRKIVVAMGEMINNKDV